MRTSVLFRSLRRGQPAPDFVSKLSQLKETANMPLPRLPDHLVTQIIIRLEHEQPILKIHTELGVARSAIYKINDNLKAWGTPYPPERAMRPGPERLLHRGHIDVRDRPGYGVEFVLTLLIGPARIPRRPAYCLP
jgi:hypothetical protein